MVFHMQRRWRLKFRRDPDAGRVLFIGPAVISLDVIGSPASKRLRMCWTCCNACHTEHSNKAAARLHWMWLRAIRKA